MKDTVDDGDNYVLGTHDAELERLGEQHRVWRPFAQSAWQRAGITGKSRVLDVGAGPGYATLDLAELVTSEGSVVAVERSERFVEHGRSLCSSRGFNHVEFHHLDLMTEEIPASGFDVAWIRWVASFVSSPARLVETLASSVRTGGHVVFHEYANYASFRFAPRKVFLEQFVQRVMDSWREAGGEPDVGMSLPSVLAEHGFQLRSVEPHLFCVRPNEPFWQWTASFIEINLDRLLEQGRVEEEWVQGVRNDLTAAARNPYSFMMTPMLLELIAEKI